MKLGHKLVLAVGLALAVAGGAGLFGIFRLDGAIATYARVIAADYGEERLANAMLVDFKTQVQEWKNTLLRGKDPKHFAKHWASFEKHEAKVQDSARRLLAGLPEGEVRTRIEQFARSHAALGEAYRKGLEAFKAAGYDHAAGDRAVEGIDREPARLLGEVGDKVLAKSASAVARAEAGRKAAMIASFAFMLGALLAGTCTAWLLARSVTRQLGGEPGDALTLARAIAEGDLAVEAPVRAGDSASVMAAMQAMRDNLCRIVGQVRKSSDSISIGSSQIAGGNADLSHRTNEQASALEETTASMEQVNAAVRQTADNAARANDLALDASSVAAKGGALVGEVVGTMRGIDESSRRIADIIGVIDGIAFQTNILALNAAVEAARAGEEGRGFAVVAAEVRTLAQRSAEAAREIKALILASGERVERGSALVDGAGTTMSEIVGAIERVSQIIGEISRASTEQSAGVAQVGEAIAQMDQATQQNAALVEQSAAAAESLEEQAKLLVRMVSVFRLPGEARAPGGEGASRAVPRPRLGGAARLGASATEATPVARAEGRVRRVANG